MIRANALFVLAMASVLSCAHANLHRAARDNDAGFFTDDLSPEALNQREPGSGQTPLMAASLAGAHLAVDRLLSLGADHSLGEKDGYNPHGVAFQGRPEQARALVKHGVPIDGRTATGTRRCIERYGEVVRIILRVPRFW